MTLNERIVIEKLKKKDYSTFETFYYEYVGLVHYIISIYIKDANTIDDVTQEVFMRIIEKINLFDDYKASLKTWIATLTKNYTINYLKQNQNKYQLDEGEVEKKSTTNTTEYQLQKQDLKSILEPLEYQVLFLKIEENMKHKEISLVLNISIDVSKKTYLKAIQKAKAYYSKK